MPPGRLFSGADLERIREAIRRAEARTSGEIVPYVMAQVDDYHEARWRGATLGSLAGALLGGWLSGAGLQWGGEGVAVAMAQVALPTLAGAAAGYTLGRFSPLGRYLVTSDDVHRRVALRAEAAFLEEEVFRTRERTGILIFLALFERQAVILADRGIHRAVPDNTWEGVIAELVAGIRAGRTVDALCRAIEHCGEILERYRVERRPDDRDELEDGLRLRER